jgi:hypothetical protein
MAAPRTYKSKLDADDQEAVDEFHAKVNMTGRELERWLASEESVGDADDSARKIVSILGKRRMDYSSADIAHMRKVVGYINRHLAHQPAGDGVDGAWRASLMNWGHDPEKVETPNP